MKLRASYPADTKLATLIHELAHVLLDDNDVVVSPGADGHNILFLFLYDTWIALENEEFAKEQVEVEKRRGQRYVDAWNKALSLSKSQRSEEFEEVITK